MGKRHDREFKVEVVRQASGRSRFFLRKQNILTQRPVRNFHDPLDFA